MRLLAAVAIAAFSMLALGGQAQGCGATICAGDSWQAAYVAATPGTELTLEGGVHPAQVLSFDPSKTSTEDVVFRPAPGASVSVVQLNTGSNALANGAKHFEVRDVAIGDTNLRRGAEDVTLRNVDGGSLNISSAVGVNVLGGDFTAPPNGVIHLHSAVATEPSNEVLFDGVYMHDLLVSDPANHSECLHVWGYVGSYTVRGSVLQNCTDFGALDQAKHAAGSVIRWENNFVDEPMPGAVATTVCSPGCPRSGNSLRFTSDITNATIIVRHNALLGGLSSQATGSVSYVSNVSKRTSCYGLNATHVKNIWTGVSCPGDNPPSSLASLFVDPDPFDGTMDLHLLASASAIDAGDPTNSPATDIDGEIRPQGAGPDVGADEVPALDSTAPSAPTGLAISDPTATSAVLSWGPSSDAVGVVGYRIYRDAALVMDTTGLSVLVTGLEAESHLLEAEAYDAAGNVSARSPLTIRRSWEA